MKHLKSKPLLFAAITLALLGLIGTCTTASATTTLPATKIVDFDGDRRSDIMLFDTSIARWFTYDFYQGTFNQFDIGSPGLSQVVGDYDGDGMSDFAFSYVDIKNDELMWHISYSTYGPKGEINWGSLGDIPVPADYDGDGKTDIAVFRPSQAVWYIRLSGSNSMRVEDFGYATDKLVPADYDGDGMADIAVMRPEMSEWYILFSSDRSFHVIPWDVTSMPGDVMVPGDYDGDGLADIGVYRKDSGFWIILESYSGQYRSAQFGHDIYTGNPMPADVTGPNFDLPMPGDFDGDGIIDITVWSSESKVVNVLPSSSSLMHSMPVGTENSKPVTLTVLSHYLD